MFTKWHLTNMCLVNANELLETKRNLSGTKANSGKRKRTFSGNDLCNENQLPPERGDRFPFPGWAFCHQS